MITLAQTKRLRDVGFPVVSQRRDNRCSDEICTDDCNDCKANLKVKYQPPDVRELMDWLKPYFSEIWCDDDDEWAIRVSGHETPITNKDFIEMLIMAIEAVKSKGDNNDYI